MDEKRQKKTRVRVGGTRAYQRLPWKQNYGPNGKNTMVELKKSKAGRRGRRLGSSLGRRGSKPHGWGADIKPGPPKGGSEVGSKLGRSRGFCK